MPRTFEESVSYGNVSEWFIKQVFDLTDERGQRKRYDFSGKIEVKTWYQSGHIVLETLSVIEKQKLGWALNIYPKTTYAFVQAYNAFPRPRKVRVFICPGTAIQSFMAASITENNFVVECRYCQRQFILKTYQYNNVDILHKTQSTERNHRCAWHSSAIFVYPENIIPHLIGEIVTM